MKRSLACFSVYYHTDEKPKNEREVADLILDWSQILSELDPQKMPIKVQVVAYVDEQRHHWWFILLGPTKTLSALYQYAAESLENGNVEGLDIDPIQVSELKLLRSINADEQDVIGTDIKMYPQTYSKPGNFDRETEWQRRDPDTGKWIVTPRRFKMLFDFLASVEIPAGESDTVRLLKDRLKTRRRHVRV